ncbi:hypothetical protein L6R53_09945 [Myxococcota bacterium]|nr:hypothetical protein [Myxococcota bacterium]
MTRADGRWARVDALFAGEPPAPPVDLRPRVRRLQVLVGVAVALDLLGMLVTVVPGAVMTLWAWLAADAEVAHIEAGGAYDEDAAAAVLGMRNVARWAMLFCVVCLLAQAWLLHQGFYNMVWAVLLETVTGIWGRLA